VTERSGEEDTGVADPSPWERFIQA